MPTYEFRVKDKEGTWGDMRAVDSTQEQAEERVRRWLKLFEIEPRGSLHPKFWLEFLREEN